MEDFVIEVLQENDIPAPKDVYYALHNDEPLVSENKEDWYMLLFGVGRFGGKMMGLVPIDTAPEPTDSLKAKFGLVP